MVPDKIFVGFSFSPVKRLGRLPEDRNERSYLFLVSLSNEKVCVIGQDGLGVEVGEASRTGGKIVEVHG
ncbi:MAG: hypothetical protein OJF50_003186 [Nitrospira sp.]|jgi:hypothetical protein|nr:hypothetical protein [Nitrospira sp.]